MLDIIKGLENAPIAKKGEEISAPALLEALGLHREKTLVFHYEGRDVLPGYHVTEVKSGHFQALDCGANFESWHETFIQLWDIPQEGERRFMPVSKFLGIIGKVAKAIPIQDDAKVTFEVSDGVKAMALYRAESLDMDGDIIRVCLSQRPSSCKPRDRWLEEQDTQSCCTPSVSSEKPCCG
jgi:hypothetical protein